jgi:hypothetical protein
MFAIGEIRIERFTSFLNQRDLAMFESLPSANNEQPAPCGDLDIGNLESCDFRDAWACIAEERSQRKGQSVISPSSLFSTTSNRIPFGFG